MKTKIKTSKAQKTITKTVKKDTETTVKYSVPLYTKDGVSTGEASLPEKIFIAKPSIRLIAQAVRVYLSNKRTAKAKTKTRAEVARTTKKVYKQKGTGGARHGSRRAPIYVGGGIAHGPRGNQNYKLSLPLNMKKLALASALSVKLTKKQISIADIEKTEPKAKILAGILKKTQVNGKITIVHAGSVDLVKAGRNIKNLNIINAADLSAYHCFVGGELFLTQEALPLLEKRFTK